MIEIMGWERLVYHILIVLITAIGSIGWALMLVKKRKSWAISKRINKQVNQTNNIANGKQ
jgi:hypothetical protein